MSRSRETPLEPDSPFDPFKSPSRRMVAMSYLALPLLIDRAGGMVTVSVAELQQLQGRYGGRVGVVGEMTKDGVWTLRLQPLEPKPPEQVQ